MTIIKKQNRKKLIIPPFEILELRAGLETGDEENIPNLVQTALDWPFLRGDFYHWIKVLDRFDSILERVINEIDLNNKDTIVSQNPSHEETILLTCSILDFTRLLMENCVNRNLYSSFDRLIPLLRSSHTEVLQSCLRLVLQMTQSGSFQQEVRSSIITALPQLSVLTETWLPQTIVDSLTGIQNEPSEQHQGLLPHQNELKLLIQKRHLLSESESGLYVEFSFYRSSTDVLSAILPKGNSSSALPSDSVQSQLETPKQQRSLSSANSIKRKSANRHGSLKKKNSKIVVTTFPSQPVNVHEGLVNIQIHIKDIRALTCLEIFDRLRELYYVPIKKQFDLLQRIRVALALSSSKEVDFDCLLKCRLYSTAVMALASSKDNFFYRHLKSHPNLTNDLVDLLKPEINTPLDIQTAVMYTLSAILGNGYEITSIFSSLNISANHGIVLFILRKIFYKQDIAAAEASAVVYPREFRNALYFLINMIIGTPNGVRLLVSSGIIPALVDSFKHTESLFDWDVAKVTRIIGSLVGVRLSAFQAFCDVNGITELTNRIKYQVDLALQSELTKLSEDEQKYTKLPYSLSLDSSSFDSLYIRPEVLRSSQIVLLRELFILLSRKILQNGNQDRLRNLVESSLPQSLIDVFEHPITFGTNIYGFAIDIMASIVHNEPTSLSILQEIGLPQAFIRELSTFIPPSGDVVSSIPNGLGAICLNEPGVEMCINSSILTSTFKIFSDLNYVKILQDEDVAGPFGMGVDEFIRHFPNFKQDVMNNIVSSINSIELSGRPGSSVELCSHGPSKLFISNMDADKKDNLFDIYGMMVESMCSFLEGLLEDRTHDALFIESKGWSSLLSCIKSDILPFSWATSKTMKSMIRVANSIANTSVDNVFTTTLDFLHDLVFQESFTLLLEDEFIEEAESVVKPLHVSSDGYIRLNELLHLVVSVSGTISLATDLLIFFGAAGTKPNLSLSNRISSEKSRLTLSKLSLLYKQIYKLDLNIFDYVEAIEKEIDGKPRATPLIAPDSSLSNMDIDSITEIDKFKNSSMAKRNTQYLAEATGKLLSSFSKLLINASKQIVIKKSTPEDTLSDFYLTSSLISKFIISNLHEALKIVDIYKCLRYLNTIVGISCTLLLRDKVKTYIQVPILASFVIQGGLETCLEISKYLFLSLSEDKITREISKSYPLESKKHKEHKNRILGLYSNTAEMFLTFSYFLNSGALVLDYPCLLYVKVSEKKSSELFFIDANSNIVPQLLISHIHANYFPIIKSIWMSDNLTKLSSNVIEFLLPCMSALIDGEYEARDTQAYDKDISNKSARNSNRPDNLSSWRLTDTSLSDYYNSLFGVQSDNSSRADSEVSDSMHSDSSDTSNRVENRAGDQIPSNVTSSGLPVRGTTANRNFRTVVPNQEHVESLVLLGFSRTSAENALSQTFNSIDRAADFLLNNNEPAANEIDTTAPTQEVTSNSMQVDNEPLLDSQETGNITADTVEASNETDHAVEASNASNTEGSANESIDSHPSDSQQIPTSSDVEPMFVEDTIDTIDTIDTMATGSVDQNPDPSAESIQVDTTTPSDSAGLSCPTKNDPNTIQGLSSVTEDKKVVGIADESMKRIVKELVNTLSSYRRDLSDSIPARISQIVSASGSKFDSQMSTVLNTILKRNPNTREDIIGELAKSVLQLSQLLIDSKFGDGISNQTFYHQLLFWSFLLNDTFTSPLVFPYSKKIQTSVLKVLASLLDFTNSKISDPSNGKAQSSMITFPMWLTPSILFVTLFLKIEEEPVLKAIPVNAGPLLTNEPNHKATLNPGVSGDFESVNAEKAKPDINGKSKVDIKGESAFTNTKKDQDGSFNISMRSGPQKDTLRDIALKMMDLINCSNIQKSPDMMNAFLRLMLFLTRDEAFSTKLVETGNFVEIIRMLKKLPDTKSETEGLKEALRDSKKKVSISSIQKSVLLQVQQDRTLVMLIIRHVIESVSVLRGLISVQILNSFDSPQLRHPEIINFMRANSAAALRNNDLFVELVNKHCALSDFDASNKNLHSKLSWKLYSSLSDNDVQQKEESMRSIDHSSFNNAVSSNISLSQKADMSQPQEQDSMCGNEASIADVSDGQTHKKHLLGEEIMDIDVDSQRSLEKGSKKMNHFEPLDKTSVSNAQKIVSALIDELLSLRDEYSSAKPLSKNNALNSIDSISLKHVNNHLSIDGVNCGVWFANSEISAYRCFILQLLYELLSSCPVTLTSVLTRNNNNSNANSLSSKVRSPLISHLIHDLTIREASVSSVLSALSEVPHYPATTKTDGTNRDALSSPNFSNSQRLPTDPTPSTTNSDANLSRDDDISNAVCSNQANKGDVVPIDDRYTLKSLYAARSQLCLTQIYWARMVICLLCPEQYFNPLSALQSGPEALKYHTKPFDLLKIDKPSSKMPTTSKFDENEQGLPSILDESTVISTTSATIDQSSSSETETYDSKISETLNITKQLVLDHITRALKETVINLCQHDSLDSSCSSSKPSSLSQGSVDIAYIRLKAISSLTYHLLTAKPSCSVHDTVGPPTLCSFYQDSNVIIGRMMLERGVFDLLTVAITQLDLNYPHSKFMLNVFLKPMATLTKISLQLNKVLPATELQAIDKSDKHSGLPLTNTRIDLDYISNTYRDLIDSLDDEDIPPDLYQNSALGLIHGNLDRASGAHGGQTMNGIYESDSMDYSDQYEEDSSLSYISDIDSDMSDSSNSRYNNEHPLLISDLAANMSRDSQESSIDGEAEHEGNPEWTGIEFDDEAGDEDNISIEMEDGEHEDDSHNDLSSMSEDEDYDGDYDGDLGEFDESLVQNVLDQIENDELNFESDSQYFEGMDGIEDIRSQPGFNDFGHNRHRTNRFGSNRSRVHSFASTDFEDEYSDDLGTGYSTANVNPSNNSTRFTRNERRLRNPARSEPEGRSISSQLPQAEEPATNVNSGDIDLTRQNTATSQAVGVLDTRQPFLPRASSSSRIIPVRLDAASDSNIHIGSSHNFQQSISRNPSVSLGQPLAPSRLRPSLSLHNIAGGSDLNRAELARLNLNSTNENNFESNQRRGAGFDVGNPESGQNIYSNSSSQSTGSNTSDPFNGWAAEGGLDALDMFEEYASSGESTQDEDNSTDDDVSQSDYSYDDMSINNDSLHPRDNGGAVNIGRIDLLGRNPGQQLMDIINVFISGQSSRNRRSGLSYLASTNQYSEYSHPLLSRNSGFSDPSSASRQALLSRLNISSLSERSTSSSLLQNSFLTNNTAFTDFSQRLNMRNGDNSAQPRVPESVYPSQDTFEVLALSNGLQISILNTSREQDTINATPDLVNSLPVDSSQGTGIASAPMRSNESMVCTDDSEIQNVDITPGSSMLTSVDTEQVCQNPSTNTQLIAPNNGSSSNQLAARAGTENLSFSSREICNQTNSTTLDTSSTISSGLINSLYEVLLSTAASGCNSLLTTNERWQQESRLMYDGLATERASRLVPLITTKLAEEAAQQFKFRSKINKLASSAKDREIEGDTTKPQELNNANESPGRDTEQVSMNIDIASSTHGLPEQSLTGTLTADPNLSNGAEVEALTNTTRSQSDVTNSITSCLTLDNSTVIQQNNDLQTSATTTTEDTVLTQPDLGSNESATSNTSSILPDGAAVDSSSQIQAASPAMGSIEPQSLQQPENISNSNQPQPLENTNPVEESSMILDSNVEAEESATTQEQVSNVPDIEPLLVEVDGTMVDITDLGIDLEFLEAIPNEMRRDVISQRRAEISTESSSRITTQNTTAVSAENPSEVSQEFLDALPPDIRREVVEQQRLLQHLHQRQEQSQNTSRINLTQLGGPARGRSSAHPGQNLALQDSGLASRNVRPSLGPRLHFPGIDVQLWESDPNNPEGSLRLLSGNRGANQHISSKAKKHHSKSSDFNIQLLSSSDFGYLIKLLFLPKSITPSKALHEVVFNMCENSRTRSVFIEVLLKILSSDTTSLLQVEDIINSFIMDSAKTSKSVPLSSAPAKHNGLAQPSVGTGGLAQTPTASKKNISNANVNAGPFFSATESAGSNLENNPIGFSYTLSRLKNETSSYFPAICCLESLQQLTKQNPKAALFFLLELPSSVKDNTSHTAKNVHISTGQTGKKMQAKHVRSADELGKAKVENSVVNAEQGSSSLLVSLLRLLEKPMYYGMNNTVTELLMQLLATITKPLPVWTKNNAKLASQAKNKLSTSLSDVKPEPIEEGSSPTESSARLNDSTDAAVDLSSIRLSESLQEPSSSKKIGNSLHGASEGPRLPKIPSQELKTIVNVLVAGECSSKTFQFMLILIQHLICLDGALVTIMNQLNISAFKLAANACDDLKQLSALLKQISESSFNLNADNQDSGSNLVQPATFHQNAEAHATSNDDVISLSSNVVLMDQLQTLTLNLFSSASSHQSRILRILKAFDYISTKVRLNPDALSRISLSEQNSTEISTNPHDLIRSLEIKSWKSSEFQTLWNLLSQCLNYVQQTPILAHIASVLLPLIEAFMVVAKPLVYDSSKKTEQCKTGSSSNLSINSGSIANEAVEVDKSSDAVDQSFFLSFTDTHKKIFNSLVRNTPGLLSGSFSLLVHNPQVLDFDNKRSYVYQKLSNINNNKNIGYNKQLNLNVRRQYVFEDSFHQFAGKSGEEIRRGKLNVKFTNEEGVDVGGVTREWFQVLPRQMFNPDYALFLPSASDRITYQPNPQSWANPDHLLYFKFVGRVIGKAICDQRLLDAYFTRSFYKHMLGKPVDYRDMEALDPEFAKSLQWMLDNDITGIVDEMFSMEVDDFGQHRVINLIPNGQDIPVTEENKSEFVKLVSEQRLSVAIRDQIEAFLTGFHELVPKDLIQIMNEQEIELLISGMPDIDVDDWRNNTEYHSGYTSTSPQIQWFWRAVRSFDQEERAKLLQFVTGTSKVPLEGFSKLQGSGGIQKFQIHRDFSSTARLPSAHTCFNQLDIPLYDTYEYLRSQLLLAISECTTGFGFI